jgi:hypothetical protein
MTTITPASTAVASHRQPTLLSSAPAAPRRPLGVTLPVSADRPPLWDARSGRFDAYRLRLAIVARGWTVAEFVGASGVSRSCLYKALGSYAVGDRTVVRILAALDTRPPTRLLDDD